VIVLTRWATDDLAGKLLEAYPDKCHVLEITALDIDGPEGVSTCEDLFPTEDLQDKRQTLDSHIWGANYMQKPVDLEGGLYGKFETYDEVDPDKFERVLNYTDTADEGDDYLGSICGGTIGRYLYVTDIYYTQEAMEKTEPELARRLQLAGVRECLIESNNGGRGFARNVIRHLRTLKCFKCTVTWFHQSKKKRTRIITNASNVMEQVIMPRDWETRWPEAAEHIITKEDVRRFREAGADILLFPAPGTVPGITMEYVRELVSFAHELGALTITAIGTSKEGTDAATIRQIALLCKMTGTDIHHLGDTGYTGMALPDNIQAYSVAIRGVRHTYHRMAASVMR